MSFARYWAVQFVRNQDCPEPETIGVIVDSDSGSALRVIGLVAEESAPDLSIFRHAYPELVGTEWIYEQWVDWFQRTTRNLRNESRESSLSALVRLEERAESFIASVSGEVAVGETESVADAADSLYDQLVMTRPAMRKAHFLGDVDRFLKRTELKTFDGFYLDAEVAIENADGGVTDLFFFPYFWDSSFAGRSACKTIWAGDNPSLLCANVAEAFNSFKLAHTIGLLEPSRCAVLVGSDFPERYKEMLAVRAVVIDIYSNEAEDQVREIFDSQ